MGLLQNLRAVRQAFAGAPRGRVPDNVRLLLRRPAILLGNGCFEGGLMMSNRLDARLKCLAGLKTSALIGCPF